MGPRVRDYYCNVKGFASGCRQGLQLASKSATCRQGLQLVVCLWLCVSDCACGPLLVIVCLWFVCLWLRLCVVFLWSCCVVVCCVLRSGGAHCDLALAAEVRRGTLPASARG